MQTEKNYKAINAANINVISSLVDVLYAADEKQKEEKYVLLYNNLLNKQGKKENDELLDLSVSERVVDPTDKTKILIMALEITQVFIDKEQDIKTENAIYSAFGSHSYGLKEIRKLIPVVIYKAKCQEKPENISNSQ